MNRKRVRELLAETSPAPEVVTPKPEPVTTSEIVAPASKFVNPATPVIPPLRDAFAEWLRSPQGSQLSHLRNVNMSRLGFVYEDRVRAIFEAGYAAGVDAGI